MKPARFRLLLAGLLTLGCVVGLPLAGNAQLDVDRLEQESLHAAANSASSFVVRIETIGGMEKVGGQLVNQAPTSGIVVDPDGYIISSAVNFIQEPNSILIQLPNGKRRAAEIVSRDHSRSLVLLKVEVDEPLAVPEVVPASSVTVGQWAITVGRTLPVDGFNMTVGIVSAKGRVWGKAIQIDANVSPANYGGALVDIYGRIVGVLVPMSPDSSSVVAGSEWYDSGIGFAVPLDSVMQNLNRLKEGELYAGKMGVSMKSQDLYGAEPVIGVSRPKSPAREAGIISGDRITAINGVTVDSHSQMKHILGPLFAGETIQVDFKRAEESFSRELVLTDKLEPYEHAFLGILPGRIPDSEDAIGVLVRYVYEGSPAKTAGIEPGDRILSIGEKVTNDAVELRTAIASLEPEDKIVIKYRSGEDEKSADVSLASIPVDVPDELPDAFEELMEENEDLPPLGRINVKLPEEEGECLAWIPENYDPRVEHGLMVVLPVPGTDVEELLDAWRDPCEETRAILLMPQAKDSRAWLPTETQFIRKTIENVRNEYSIDAQRIVVGGSSTSGSMAILTALSHRDLVRGAVSFGGPVPGRSPSLINEPLQRLAFWFSSSEKSRSAGRVKSNVAQIRKTKVPVTHRQLDGSEDQASLHEEVLRWVDTLDRI